EPHWLLQPISRKPRGVQRREAVAVEPLLDARDALIVDVHEANEMRDLGPVGIDALVLVEEADAGNAEAVDVLLLLRRDLALEPGKAALPVGEALADFLGFQVLHHGGEQLDRL